MQLDWEIDIQTENQLKSIHGTQAINNGKNLVSVDLPKGTICSASATISLQCSSDEKIFMNGYQTWTTCPEYSVTDKMRGLHHVPKFVVDKYGLDRYGDYDFVSYLNKAGVTHGESWCYFRHGKQFRLLASINEENGYTMFQYDANKSLLTMVKDCVGLEVSGSFPLFEFYYGEGAEKDVFNQWFTYLPRYRIPSEKIFGYSSWYNRYQDICEQTILEDLDGCKKIFEKGDLFQIDDGWEPAVGDWLEEDSTKFPSSMKSMTEQIHSAGFRAGLWLAPFVAEKKSQVYSQHPDWFLKKDNEKYYCGCNWSGFYALDIDNQEVQEYIRKTMNRVLNEWDYDLVKLDFLYAVAPFGNDKETRAGRMIRSMKFLREVCGDKLILGCGVPVMPSFGTVDYCRIGCDVSLDWDDVPYMRLLHRERTSTKNAIINTVYRRQLSGRAHGNDSDVFFLRSENIKLTQEQKENLAKLDALLSDVLLTSDDPGKYTDEMLRQYHEIRQLSKAKVLNVNTDHGIVIDYLLDGRTETLHLFTK